MRVAKALLSSEWGVGNSGFEVAPFRSSLPIDRFVCLFVLPFVIVVSRYDFVVVSRYDFGEKRRLWISAY